MAARRTQHDPPAPEPGRPDRPRLPPGLDAHRPGALDDDVWEQLEVGPSTPLQPVPTEIAGCRLTGVDWSGADLVDGRVADSVLSRCELSGADLTGARLLRVELLECRLSGLVLGAARLDHVQFRACKLDEVSLRMSVGTHVWFDDCVLTGADLTGARLVGARFQRCDLRGADLSQADLTDARLQGSRLERLRGADHLAGTVIDSAQVLPVAVLVFEALGIRVDDEEPGLPDRPTSA